MKKLILLVLTLLPLQVFAAAAHVELDSFKADLTDKTSLQNGARLYADYCLACHTLQFARYQRMADDLSIPHDLAMENFIFDGKQIGSLMTNAMDKKMAAKWFGVAPLDLTLVARSRSPEWLYTYLRSFYHDPSRPYGVNNKVFKDVGMPFVLLELQGLQACAPGPAKAANGGIKRDPLTGEDILFGDDGHALNPCGSFDLVEKGSMTPEEFDKAVYDMVNFLEYMGEPMALERQRIGMGVMIFLAFFLVWAWLLNREYWKDVH